VTGSDDFTLDLVTSHGMVTEEQLIAAADHASANETSIIDALIFLKYIAEADILRMVASEYGMDTFEFSPDFKIPPEVTAAMPGDIARRYRVVPVMFEHGTLTVAMADPSDLEALDSVRYILKADVDGVVASPKAIERALDYYYGDLEDSVESFLDEMTEGTLDITDVATTDVTTETGADDDDDAPIIRLVSLLILEAFRTRTSDIHLEPLEKRFRIRYRIDGVLH